MVFFDILGTTEYGTAATNDSLCRMFIVITDCSLPISSRLNQDKIYTSRLLQRYGYYQGEALQITSDEWTGNKGTCFASSPKYHLSPQVQYDPDLTHLSAHNAQPDPPHSLLFSSQRNRHRLLDGATFQLTMDSLDEKFWGRKHGRYPERRFQHNCSFCASSS